MMKRTMIVSFLFVFATSGVAMAQSTKHSVKRKTTRLPTKPTPKVPASKLKQRRTGPDLNKLRDKQCLDDIEYSTGYKIGRNRQGLLGCPRVGLSKGNHSVSFTAKNITATGSAGKITVKCKASAGKCIKVYPPHPYGKKQSSIQFSIRRTRPGQQSLSACFNRIAKMCK